MDNSLETLAKIYKALSEVTRLEILAILHWGGELCVCDIEGVLEITQSKASRHLRYLYHAGLVVARREGTWTYYRVPENPGRIQAQVLDLLERQLARDGFEALDNRLQRWLERKGTGRVTCGSR